jgi:hypothetical protein
MKIASLTLALIAAFALPVAAQQMGSANRNAPKVSQSIAFHNGTSLAVSYTALNFADGKFMENVKNERFRNMVNENAKANPVGTVTLQGSLTAGGKTLEAGSYGLHFLLQLIQWPLMLKEAPSNAQRLTISLMAGEDVTSCNIHLHFGSQHVMVPVAVQAAEEKK